LKRFIKKVLAGLGYRVQGTRYSPRHLLDPGYLRGLELADIVCRRMLETGQQLTFIQIGAFDGVMKDPLYPYIDKYGWRGVMVEPQPGPAKELRDLYRDNDDIVVLEAAVDAAAGKRKLFTVESDNVPTWARGMASFEREHIVKHSYLIPGIENMIREIEVDCIPMDEVLKPLNSDRVDLLQIDAEGADADLLALFPFERIKPAIVHWEIKNLTKLQKEFCFDRLASFGYRFAPSGGEDMMALLN
jgi:FkbM family methyltransferase